MRNPIRKRGSKPGSKITKHAVHPDSFASTLSNQVVTTAQTKTALQVINALQEEIKRIYSQMVVYLPSPETLQPGVGFYIALEVKDKSGSQIGFEYPQVTFSNVITKELLEGDQPAHGMWFGRILFNVNVEVMQPFLQLDPTDPFGGQLWFTEDIEQIAPQDREHFRQFDATGGTDLNKALLTAFVIFKMLDHWYRQHGITNKYHVIASTDGDHNADTDYQIMSTAFQVANEYDNIYTSVVSIGNQRTAEYVKQVGIPEGAVFTLIDQTIETMMITARQISSVAQAVSMSAVPQGEFNYLEAMLDRLERDELMGDQSHNGPTDINPFDAALGDGA